MTYLHDAYSRLTDSAARRGDVDAWRFLARQCEAEIAHARAMRQDASAARRILTECKARVDSLSGLADS